MRYENYSVAEHGFAGHLAEPDAGSDRAVIVVMGGEQSLLPGIKFAERFADFGIMGLAVSLLGADMAFTNVLIIFGILKGISNLLPVSAFRLGFTNGLMSESMILWLGFMLIWEAKRTDYGRHEQTTTERSTA